ncbi:MULTISPECIES: pentapeptide repeat-containing protein [unclassified Micromonospora]|uniref:pentapeptide repeat-containing protein n=1 Tax=unclassified Micromonospora TaxID=2617518 RepID=UPI0022B6F46F|nr:MULTISPECIES: pentapeptide repeat-containing protein [unclassified Micromonospora]MCZ7422703.1 pentapeptide repeat-containing protein [Verrucosispora sp. WMMA2121]WBB90445.1 pentapeptide repeat-containing protein [Verrucosispora sp. WMMC514]
MELPAAQPSTRPDLSIKVGPAPAVDSTVPVLRLWSIRRSIVLVVVAALLAVGVVVAGALWAAGWPSVKVDAHVPPSTLFDLLKLVFAVVAGIGGVAALVVAYRRQRVAEHTNRLAEFAHQLAYAADLRAEVAKALAEAADERAKVEAERNGVRLFNERFAKASEQIGSDKAAVRLAGVYAMAGLADDWEEGRQTCIDVLCAYLRMPYVPPPSDSKKDVGRGNKRRSGRQEVRDALEEREVRRTVIELVRNHLARPQASSEFEPWGADNPYIDAASLRGSELAARWTPERWQSWQGYNFNFDGAVFDGVDFTGILQSGGQFSFRNAKFLEGSTSFAGSVFGGYVSFVGAQFSGGKVSFEHVKFGGEASFRGAAFAGGEVSFSHAKFSGAVGFDEAVVSSGRVFFDTAVFDYGSVLFTETKFEGGAVFFDGAWFGRLVNVTLDEALFMGGVVSLRWPLVEQGAWLHLPPLAELPGVVTEISVREQTAT